MITISRRREPCLEAFVVSGWVPSKPHCSSSSFSWHRPWRRGVKQALGKWSSNTSQMVPEIKDVDVDVDVDVDPPKTRSRHPP